MLALESYRQRAGRYPAELSDLPDDLVGAPGRWRVSGVYSTNGDAYILEFDAFQWGWVHAYDSEAGAWGLYD